MGKKKNRIQKKNRRLAKNNISSVNNRIYSVNNNRISSFEAHKDIVSIQQLLSQIEQLLEEEINNPNSEDSSFNALACFAYLNRLIELRNKLRENGYQNIINSQIETRIKSCLELLERMPDDEYEELAVEQDTYRYLRCSQNDEYIDDDPEHVISTKKTTRMRHYNEPAWYSDD
ncbi:hypothetical protein [Okeania sp. SIO2B3]|uniref:hypothetical protein n=1 Tax=Okeania sp. SIO2B3 TaxID=2607784 RepID=UPI0013BEDF64|nr:hypothetical protein [Okeania sp. SIO2B3]NET47050.1 hypothetical protein [Okeania sp. SIO2B3]